MNEYDFTGDLSAYQRQLDEAGIDFDITNLAGLTKREIECVMGGLLLFKLREKAIEAESELLFDPDPLGLGTIKDWEYLDCLWEGQRLL